MRFLKLVLALLMVPGYASPTTLHGPAILYYYDNAIVLDEDALVQIFTRRMKKWPTGEDIVVFTKPAASIEHEEFIFNVLGISKYRYNQMLRSQTSSGNSVPNLEVRSDEEMMAKVEGTPFSIGYVNFKVIVNGKKVRVLKP